MYSIILMKSTTVNRKAAYIVVGLCIFFQLSNCSICPQEPLCDCRPNTGMFDIYCINITTLDPVTKLLHNQFRNSTINKLMFTKNCNLTTLPNNAFENISVFIFLTSCPFSDIPEDAFSGTRPLTKLDLQNTKFTTIPPGLLNLGQMKTLNLKRNSLTELNSELWNLHSLLFLSFSNGGLEKLSQQVFIRTPNIQYLDLSYNRLSHLHPDTLKPLVTLQRIQLRGNHLSTVAGLFKHLNPELIDLYDNKLTSLDNVFSQNMWSLKSLNVGKNPINYINSSSVKSMFLNLEIFDMSATKCTEIDPELFHSFPKLKKALLSRNRIQIIPRTLFHNLKSLETIDLTDNNISSIEGIFYNNLRIKEILLGSNKIPRIENSFQNLTKLEKLFMSKNTIQKLGNKDFEGLMNLQKLILSHNRIQSIESNSFTRLQNLSILELSSSSLDHLNNSLQNLLSLRELAVRSSNLKQVHRDDFLGLTKLYTLNLVDNQITSLNGVFRDLRSLKSLNIAKNKLITLSRDTFPEKIKLQMLWLANGNKLFCDCRLTWLIKWLAQVNYTVLQDNPLCHLPHRLSGRPIKAVTVKELTIWPDDCPTYCQCQCVNQGSEFFVKVDCSYRNLTRMPDVLPQELGDLDLRGNEFETMNIPNYTLTYGLVYLNMERNKITALQQNIPKYMKELRLAHNLLNRFPWSSNNLNNTLQVITLSDNPWICDCKTTDFRKWLLKNGDIVMDVNETKCGHVGHLSKLYGRVITSLNDTDLCPSVISFYISLAIGVLGSLLLATSMVLAYSRYHLYIKVWLYAHGYTWVKEDDLDTEKLFDALISCHREDEDFVFSELSPRLEHEEPKFTLCIPQRDFLCGEFEAATQMKAITDAKRVIVILTQEYVNNAFCMSIFQQAFEQSLEDKVNRVILIKLTDISKTDDMNSELKASLGSKNCITWGHKLFWERLLYAMPKKLTPENSRNDFAEERISGSSDEDPLLG